MMRERFAKLLLGEDMSGSGKGVCTAVTVSNSITNLYGSFVFLISFFFFFCLLCSVFENRVFDNGYCFAATVFGQSLRLQPLSTEKKDLWKREMNCFMSICDYIVEVVPRSLGNNVEVKTTTLLVSHAT